MWQALNGPQFVSTVSGVLFRLVESQEQAATLGYVDDLEEQAVLEELLEGSKPPLSQQASALHYLLSSPFRYPPLHWGSRFGRVHEPSLLYGGKTPGVTLAESAYYRLLHIHSIQGKPPKTSLKSEHTLFSVPYFTKQGICLHQPPFDCARDALTHPCNYTLTQKLGSEMREAGVIAFEYWSARSTEEEICVALYQPEAFSQPDPASIESWLCETAQDRVTFKGVGQRSPLSFYLEQFLIDGSLPRPA